MTDKLFKELHNSCMRHIEQAMRHANKALELLDKMKPRDERPLKDFRDKLSTRTLNVLEYNMNLATIGDLLKYIDENGLQSILKRRNAGKKTVTEIREFIETYKAGEI